MRNLLIALFPVDTVRQLRDMTLQDKFALLADSVRSAAEFLRNYAARQTLVNPLLFFVAPEYYFVKNVSPNGQEWELYSGQEKDEILGLLLGLSREHREMTIFPGTVYWKRLRGRAANDHSSRDFEGINVALVFRNGKCVLEHEKKSDDGTCEKFTQDVTFLPGKGRQTFTVHDVKVGIEVCRDFEFSHLAQDTRALLDLEIYISAGNPHGFTNQIMGGIPVRDGGYLVHCDSSGEQARNGVWLINRGKGSHGLSKDISTDCALYDAYSGRPVPSHTLQKRYAQHGVSGDYLALSKVFKVTLPHKFGSVVNLPVLLPSRFGRDDYRAPMGGQYGLRLTEVRPTQITEAGFTAQVTATLVSRPPGARLNGAAIKFSSQQGDCRPAYGITNAQGVAAAEANIAGFGPIRFTAKWEGVESNATFEVEDLGMGNVTRMPRLHGNPHETLQCWHVIL